MRPCASNGAMATDDDDDIYLELQARVESLVNKSMHMIVKLTQHVFNFGLAKTNRELSSKLCDFVLKLNFTRCCFLTKIQFGPHVGLVDTTVKLKITNLLIS